MRVLIAVNEKRFAEALLERMQEKRYAADAVFCGADALAYARAEAYDVIVLDAALPDGTGLDVSEQLAGEGITASVLMLTDQINDRGDADDSMHKPCLPEELIDRIRALSHRQGDAFPDSMTYADLSLDMISAELSAGERRVQLSYLEFEVLRLLLTARGGVVSKEEMLTEVWGGEMGVRENNAEAYISRLRKKLFQISSKVSIVSVRGAGYWLEAE